MIAIRAARPEDAGAIAAIYAPYVLGGTVSFESEAPDARAMRTRMTTGDGLYPWLVVTTGEGEGDAVLGYAYAASFRARPAYRYVVEVSAYIAGDAQRMGMGRSLFQALIATLRTQGFTQAIGVVALPNEASVGLHESIGFRKIAIFREIGFKMGRWVDVGYWQRDLNDVSVPPVEPKAFAEVGVVRA